MFFRCPRQPHSNQYEHKEVPQNSCQPFWGTLYFSKLSLIDKPISQVDMAARVLRTSYCIQDFRYSTTTMEIHNRYIPLTSW